MFFDTDSICEKTFSLTLFLYEIKNINNLIPTIQHFTGNYYCID